MAGGLPGPGRSGCVMDLRVVGASLLLVAVGLTPASGGATAGAAAAAPAADQVVRGCQGWDEDENTPYVGPVNRSFVIGSPRRAVRGVPQAGVVEFTHWVAGKDKVQVRLTSSMLGVPEQAKGWFGASVARTQATSGDDCGDLAIGMPGANGGSGAVVIVPDFGTGLEPASAVWLPTKALGLRPGDRLGASVAASALRNAPRGLVVAGAPGRDAAGVVNSGALVSWLIPVDPGTPSRAIRPAAPVSYVQGTAGMLGRADRNDRFGSVLAMSSNGRIETLRVGVPKEDIRSRGKPRKDAGAVAVMTFTKGKLTGNSLLWRGHGLPGVPRTGDQLGAAVAAGPDVWNHDDWAAGMPGRNANGRADSGALIVWDRGTRRYRVVTQSTHGVPDRSEKGDRFGASLAVFTGGAWEVSTIEMAIGVPGEKVGRRRGAGAVTYLTLADAGGEFPFSFRPQRTSGLAAGDAFGSSLLVAKTGDVDQVIFGAPGEDRPRARNAGRYYAGDSHGSIMRYADGVTPNERLGG